MALTASALLTHRSDLRTQNSGLRTVRRGRTLRRHILVISRDEQLGRRFRYLLAGLRIGFPTTVVADMAAALPVLKRLRPRVVIFVAENGGKADDQLMLLRTLLLLGEQGDDDVLALLYDPGRDRLTMYHNIQLSGLRPEDVAQAVVETVSCPLFGCEEERRAGYPKDCPFLPFAITNAALAVESLGKSKREVS